MRKRIDAAISSIGGVLLGKEREVRLALCSVLAGGHLLIEDLPGMGKTTLAHALATVLGLDFNRVQFTSDLLPADIIGVSVFDAQRNEFQFRQGPIFTQLLLADEINRTTPKTQSALLEAMSEHQVSVDGETYALSDPFFVIATQNPTNQFGTFPLPESQLDRFLFRLSLGYPDPTAERRLLAGEGSGQALAALKPVVTPEQLVLIQNKVQEVHTSDSLLDYLQRLIAFTREEQEFAVGLSPRGALALLRAAKAWALMEGRGHVVPEDLQAVFIPVAGHRICGTPEEAESRLRRVLEQVPVLTR